MTFVPNQLDELLDRMDRVCNGNATPDDMVRIEELARADDELCWAYICYSHLHAGLRWAPVESLLPDAEQSTAPLIDELDDFNQTHPHSTPTRTSLPGFLSNTLHGTLAYFSEGMPLAYLLATAIVGVGLLIGSRVYVSDSERIAWELSPATKDKATRKPATPFVGRITGMADCQWADSQTQTFNGASVSLGRKYILSSGLMEITYDTGAKVILQGPCTYEVESSASGFLSVGKLTARLESGAEKPGAGDESNEERRTKNEELSASSSSFVVPHSAFAVRTPTATVTDLGTEFGVEVDERGGTQSYVFRGRVLVRSIAREGKTSQAIELGENQSVRIDSPRDGQQASVARDVVDPTTFIREIAGGNRLPETKKAPFENWLAYSRKVRQDPSLVVYYSMEKHRQGTSILPNQSLLGSEMDGEVGNAEWVEGRLPGKLALYFRGPGSGDKVTIPQQERFCFHGPFSVAVWFKSDSFSTWWQTLITKGNDCWRLQRHGGTSYLCFDAECFDDGKQPLPRTFSRTEVDDRQWHFAVGVYEPVGNVAKRRLYIDGKLEAVNDVALPLQQNSHRVGIGCNETSPGREFQGLIDEVAIFSRALSAEEVAEWFQKGSNTTKRLERKTAK